MMGLLCIFAFCFQVRGLAFLQKAMINDERNVVPCSKRAFSDVLEGVVQKILSLCFDSSCRLYYVALVYPLIWPGMPPFPMHRDCAICVILAYNEASNSVSDMMFYME